MTVAQIAAIVSLLIAFNAPANQVADIQRILTTSQTANVVAEVDPNPQGLHWNGKGAAAVCRDKYQFKVKSIFCVIK